MRKSKQNVKSQGAARQTGGPLAAVARTTGALVSLAMLLLVSLELYYRFQVVDMYKPELRAYNSPAELAARQNTILALGDSFTAGDSYVNYLRILLPQYRVINGGISGTGVLQARLVLPLRFKQFHPTVLIYQVYVGNDLFDLRYPVNWRNVSLARNLYWEVAERLRGVAFLNYRLGQLTHRDKSLLPGGGHTPKVNEKFAEAKYSPRPRIYVNAEPGLIEDSVLLRGRRATDYRWYMELLKSMLTACKQGSCEAYILVIPHCAQLNTLYLNEYRRLGATFADPNAFQQREYPFISGLRKELLSMPNVKIVNALPVLRAAEEQGQRVFYPNDEHLNPEGQQVISQLLFGEITHDRQQQRSRR